MEKFGLVNALKFLADNSLQVSTLVTDRHKQLLLSTWLRSSQASNIGMMCGTFPKVC